MSVIDMQLTNIRYLKALAAKHHSCPGVTNNGWVTVHLGDGQLAIRIPEIPMLTTLPLCNYAAAISEFHVLAGMLHVETFAIVPDEFGDSLLYEGGQLSPVFAVRQSAHHLAAGTQVFFERPTFTSFELTEAAVIFETFNPKPGRPQIVRRQGEKLPDSYEAFKAMSALNFTSEQLWDVIESTLSTVNPFKI